MKSTKPKQMKLTVAIAVLVAAALMAMLFSMLSGPEAPTDAGAQPVDPDSLCVPLSEEFLQVAREYGIEPYYMAPMPLNRHSVSCYIRFVDDEIPYVSIVELTYETDTGLVLSKDFVRFYILEGYSRDDGIAFTDTMQQDLTDRLGDVSGTVFDCYHYSDGLSRSHVGFYDLGSEDTRIAMADAGLLSSADAMTFQAEEKALLDEGYVK